MQIQIHVLTQNDTVHICTMAISHPMKSGPSGPSRQVVINSEDRYAGLMTCLPHVADQQYSMNAYCLEPLPLHFGEGLLRM